MSQQISDSGKISVHTEGGAYDSNDDGGWTQTSGQNVGTRGDPGSGGDPSGGAKTLTQNQVSQVRKINNAVDDHLTDMDISGAVADQMGSPIPKPGGGFWDHTKEVGEAMDGVRTKIKKLEKVEHPDARKAVEKGKEAIDRAEDSIKGAGI